jgi:polygalacturonase
MSKEKSTLNFTLTEISFFLAFVIFLLSGFYVALNAQSKATNNVYNVRSYGAIGDGKKLDSPAINKAIDAAVKAGGGTVLVPAGTYLSGSIHLQSNINLHIDAGATILGAPRK